MTTGLVYNTAVSTLPGWVPDSFKDLSLGYGYESAGFRLHLFGQSQGQWAPSSGATFWQTTNEDLEDWATKNFAASNFRPLRNEIGTVIDGVWRPGLYFELEMQQAFGQTRSDRRASEQTLHLLVDALRALFLAVEPTGPGLDSFGPRMRELLILACTEVEDAWSHYMRLAGVTSGRQGWTTRDYVRLAQPLFLSEFRVRLEPYLGAPVVEPFTGWTAQAPTQSLAWYHAYNQTKHDRSAHLDKATLRRCIEAVAANVVMFCVRYGPAPLFEQNTPVASLVNHLFSVELVGCDPATFYIPLIDPPVGNSPALGWGNGHTSARPWVVSSLVV